jgi:regulator of sigma E protease
LSFFDVALPFILLLGGLIFVHELGHFLVAKAFRVKVEKFAIGFGPALLRRRVGETEYLIAALPLGGYVKMLGEQPGETLPDAERARAFNHQPVWRRVSIASAGPAMNLVFPIVVLAAVYMIGVPTPTTLVGGVAPESPAARAGLEPGDRIVEVEGQEVWRWRDFSDALGERKSGPIALVVERGAERRDVTLLPETTDAGTRIGVEHSPPAALVLVLDDSPAWRAGLRSGDRVTALAGKPIADWFGLQRALAGAEPPLEVEVARATAQGDLVVRARIDADASALAPEAVGLRLADSEMLAIEPGSPAEQAGLQPGDVIARVDGATLASFADLAAKIRGGGGAPLRLEVVRKGEPLSVEVTPVPRTLEREPGKVEQSFAIGVQGGARRVPGELRDDVASNPIAALRVGATITGELFVLTLGGLKKLVTREVGLDNLAGPIRIGELAASSYEESWFQFFWVMAVISVNLAILNLLPIPILDGGQIVFALAEGVRGGPLSLRVREVAQQVGLSLLFLLMGFAFWNDLSRHWGRILDFFQSLS